MADSAINQDTIELVHSNFYIKGKDFVAPSLLLLVLMAVLCLGLVLILGWENFVTGFDKFKPVEKFAEKWTEDRVDAITDLTMLIILLLTLPVIWLAGKQRVIIDSKGIYYRTNLPTLFRWAHKDWEFQWHDIQAAELVSLKGFQQRIHRVINIVSHNRKQKLVPSFWKTKEELLNDSGWYGLKLRWRKVDAMENLLNSILFKKMKEAGVSIDITETEDKSTLGFALEKHPRTIVFMFGFAILGLYIFVDGLTVPETYPSVPGIYEIVWASITLGLVTLLIIWLRVGDVPRGVCLGLGFLSVFVIYPCLYIGTLRVNMLTDTVGLTSYHYRVQPGIELFPERIDLPVITYFDQTEFWNQYLPDKTIDIELRRGGLNIWQFNLEKVRDLMREYHETNIKGVDDK